MPNPDPKPDTDWPEVRLASAEEKLKSGRFLYIVEREVETVNFGISPFKSITSETLPFEPSDAIAAIRELKAENARLKDLFQDKPYLSDAELNRVKTIVWCGLGITLSQDVGLRVYEELSDRRVDAKARDAKILKLERNNARLRAGLEAAKMDHQERSDGCDTLHTVREDELCTCSVGRNNAAINDVLAGPGATTEEGGA